MRFCFDNFDFVAHSILPEKMAIIGSNSTITWLEFSKKVADLIVFLEKQNWHKTTSPIVIYGHKQTEMIIAFYACMKLGIPYVPIDIAYPKDRILKVIDASKSQRLINCTTETLEWNSMAEINWAADQWNISKNTNELISVAPLSDPLVYLIFTSGSTGEPKGVQISRSAIQTFVRWMSSDFGFTKDAVFTNVAVFSFDLSVFEVMTFSSLGATLLLNENAVVEDPSKLLNRIESFAGTVLVATPSYAIRLIRMEEEAKKSPLRHFLFCGEVLPHQLAKTLKKLYGKATIFNTYGPTEATVASTFVEIDEKIIAAYNPLPVGFSKPESELLLENEEIVIVGDNVSLGYVNRPDLNEQKFFISNGKRAFRTGDLGYFLDGMLFCKGRNDDQIKLHGYRIELNEITAKLNEIDFIFQAETIALRRNDEVKKVVSLVQLDASKIEDIADFKKAIISHLAKNLPQYMIPSDFKQVKIIPLNQNGKSDKKELERLYLSKEN
jgi:D-alanine--poly(phosphoribitol) ligase subunit 1